MAQTMTEASINAVQLAERLLATTGHEGLEESA